MNKHSPEPWSFSEFGSQILDAREGSSQLLVATVAMNTYRKEGLHNARRIIACVNACKGIPIEQLESDTTAFVEMLKEFNQIKAERDALLDVLEDAQDIASKALRKAWQLGQVYWQQADSESWSENRKSDQTQAKFQTLVDDTRAAIANAKGEKE